MKKILIITTLYPPIISSGVFRTLGFIKKLSKNYDIEVITKRIEKDDKTDENLGKSLSEKIVVQRAANFDPFIIWEYFKKNIDTGNSADIKKVVEKHTKNNLKDIFSEFLKTPDNNVFWIFSSLIKLVFKKDSVDIIYSTAPPFSTHILGVLLKKLWRVPLITDFRDPWVDNPFKRDSRPNIIEKWDNFLEGIVFKNSDLVIANTNKMSSVFFKKYPFYKGKVCVIPNGFDPENFQGINPKRDIPGNKILFVHTGSLYGKRNPLNFLKAFGRAIHKYNCENFYLQLIGPADVFEKKDLFLHVKNLKLEKFVELKGTVDHKTAISYLKGADILILFSQGTDLQVPAKLYEYIAVEKNVLCVCERNSECWDLVNANKLSYLLTENHVENILEHLLTIHEDFYRDESILKGFDSSILNSFKRENMSKIFLEKVDELA